eukprot:4777007-Pyramimonas_sp.AAC.1
MEREREGETRRGRSGPSTPLRARPAGQRGQRQRLRRPPVAPPSFPHAKAAVAGSSVGTANGTMATQCQCWS